MKILEITNTNSKAIYEYIQHLSDALTRVGNEVKIVHWRDTFNKDEFDIYHYHYSNSTFAVIIPIFLLSTRRTFVTLHDIIPRNKIWKTVIAPIFLRIIQQYTEKLIVHSHHAKDLLLQNYPFIKSDKVEVIQFGTKIVKYNVEDKRIALRSLEIKTSFNFIHVGYLKKSKGIIETIHAFNALNTPNATLFIAGKIIDPEVQQVADKNRNENIKFMGFVSNNTLHQLHIASDALINFRKDSVGETSAAVISMLNYGKPILATEIGSNPEVIKDAGILCSPDVNSMTNALKLFMEDKNLRRKTNESAIVRGKELQWTHVVKDYERIFK